MAAASTDDDPPIPAIPPIDMTKVFYFKYVEIGSDGNLYFSDSENDSLKKWDMTTDTVSVIATFENSITAMVSSSDNNRLYIAESSRLWEYNCTSTELDQTFNTPKYISSLYPAGDYLVCCIPEDSYHENLLIRLSDYTLVDSSSWMDWSRSSAYSPLHGRIYLLDMYMSSSDNIWYQEIDAVNNIFGSDISSHDGGDVPTNEPVKLFPDELRVTTGSGTIFNTDDKLTYHGSLGYDYADLAFGPDDTIYILNNVKGIDGKIQCRLINLMGTLPYLKIGISAELTSKGKRLIRNGNSLIVITQDDETDLIHVSRHLFPDL